MYNQSWATTPTLQGSPQDPLGCTVRLLLSWIYPIKKIEWLQALVWWMFMWCFVCVRLIVRDEGLLEEWERAWGWWCQAWGEQSYVPKATLIVLWFMMMVSWWLCSLIAACEKWVVETIKVCSFKHVLFLAFQLFFCEFVSWCATLQLQESSEIFLCYT
jgi:hypothetical protein